MKNFLNFRNIVACVMLVCSLGFLTACNTEEPNDSNSLSNVVTNTSAITTSDVNHKEMVKDYLEAIATVTIYSGEEQIGMGSGIAVWAGGYIATNWHVIQYVESDASKYSIQVTLYQNGEFVDYSAKLLWSNINFDLAIIRCEFHNIPFVKMADRWIESDNPIEITDEIWTLGTPYDSSLFGTYSRGEISSMIKQDSVSSGRIYESLIMHNSSISNGSSGSGLFDYDGNLLGLNTLGINGTENAKANGLYFATPIYPIIKLIPQIATLEEDGNPDTNYSFPLIGVSAYDKKISDYYSYNFNEKGMYVQEVNIDGPCYNKLHAKDIIVGISTTTATIDGEGYYKVDQRNDFLYALTNFKSGDSVKIYYQSGSVNNFAIITLK